MKYSVVIPARYGSSRLLGKPLLDIAGKPMVQRVYERACLSSATRVVIATDDERIREAALGFGAQVCMTSAQHPSGTDRIEEVTRKLELADDEIVVNVQGDEPLIPPAVIDQVAANLAAREEAGIATLCEPVGGVDELFNPNVVKVICDERGFALYFSRAPIPWNREGWAQGKPQSGTAVEAERHLGIYAYRVSFLRSFVTWPPARLETTEALEQLRAMANGIRIHVEAAAEPVPPGVDTSEDLEKVRAILAEEGSE